MFLDSVNVLKLNEYQIFI